MGHCRGGAQGGLQGSCALYALQVSDVKICSKVTLVYGTLNVNTAFSLYVVCEP